MSNKKVTVVSCAFAALFFAIMAVIGRNISLTAQGFFMPAFVFVLSPLVIGISMYASAYKNGFLYQILLPVLILLFIIALFFIFNPASDEIRILPYIGFGSLEAVIGLIGLLIGSARRKRATR